MESEYVPMSATVTFGKMTAATPATVATFDRNQRLISIVEAIMPPKPYPSPVNTEPAHKPMKLPVFCE